MKIDEPFVTQKVIEYLGNKEKGNWKVEEADVADLHEHGVDIYMRGGSHNAERFLIECKGHSYAKKAAKNADHEVWLTALGQLITRMSVERLYYDKNNKTQIKGINGAYKYGLGLYWTSAQVALKRIPYNIAKILKLYIFSVNDDGDVVEFKPSDFKNDEKLPDERFFIKKD